MSSSNRNRGAKTPRPDSRKARQIEQQRRARRRSLMLLALGAIMVVVAAIGTIIFVATRSRVSSGPTVSRVIDGIPCQTEQGTYHEHAHLTIQVRGATIHLPDGIGHGNGGCLYWLHIHGSDPAGIVHIEAPHRLVPTLGTFFDVWGQPLSATRVSTFQVSQGRRMRVFVNQKPYPGNPRLIPLKPHAEITIQVGPPFPAVTKYAFESGY